MGPDNPATKTRICPAGNTRPAGCTLITLRPKPESAQLATQDQLVAPKQPCDQTQNLPSWQHKTSWSNPDSQDQKLASRKNKSIASRDATGPDGWQSIDLFIKRIQQKQR